MCTLCASANTGLLSVAGKEEFLQKGYSEKWRMIHLKWLRRLTGLGSVLAGPVYCEEFKQTSRAEFYVGTDHRPRAYLLQLARLQ
jgi:hypothetical protein